LRCVPYYIAPRYIPAALLFLIGALGRMLQTIWDDDNGRPIKPVDERVADSSRSRARQVPFPAGLNPAE